MVESDKQNLTPPGPFTPKEVRKLLGADAN